MGVVGDGDGLPRGGIDGDGVSNGQGLVIRQDDVQRLGFWCHRGCPVSNFLMGFAIRHLDGFRVNGQTLAQFVHQGDFVGPGHQVNAVFVDGNDKGIGCTGNTGGFVLFLAHRGYGQRYRASIRIQLLAIKGRKFDLIVKGSCLPAL